MTHKCDRRVGSGDDDDDKDDFFLPADVFYRDLSCCELLWAIPH